MAQHKLVVIGDSLAQGFQSGAAFDGRNSYPAIMAHQLGCLDNFRIVTHNGPGDGIPLNLEALIRRIERKFGARVNWWESPFAALEAHRFLSEVEDYWERGPGSSPPVTGGIPHNLGMCLWDLRDAMHWTADNLEIKPPRENLLGKLVEQHIERAARVVLARARDASGRALTQVEAAAELGRDGGIETLIVELGSNNALRSIVLMKLIWSGEHYADPVRKRAYTVWRPEHFRAELTELAKQVRDIKADHVIWTTVPHVTIAPLARPVGQASDGYHGHYTRPWISRSSFDAARDPSITGDEARAVDRAVDEYNLAIREVAGDGHVVDLCAVLDAMGTDTYELPPELAALDPRPTAAFFDSGPDGRTAGGLISLDGVHPTTIGYGIIALETLKVMQKAGIIAEANVDFRRLLRLDTLISDPPRSTHSTFELVGWLDERLDWVNRTLGTRIGEKILGKDATFGF